MFELAPSYVGDFRDDLMHGEGTYTGEDGTHYTGTWRNNKKNGNGKMKYADGG